MPVYSHHRAHPENDSADPSDLVNFAPASLDATHHLVVKHHDIVSVLTER